MLLSKLSLRTRRMILIPIGILIVAIVAAGGLMSIRGTFLSDPKHLSKDLVYIDSYKVGCEGYFCVQQMTEDTRYVYQSDLTLTQLISFANSKGLELANTPTTIRPSDVEETTIVFKGDEEHNGKYMLYYALPTPELKRRFSEKQPITRNAVIEINQSALKDLER